VARYQYGVAACWRGGRFQSSAKAIVEKPVIVRTFSWPT